MRLSYILTLTAGGMISSGYHVISDPQLAFVLFLVGFSSLILGALLSGKEPI